MKAPVIPIQVSPEQANSIKEAAQETGLSQQDVIRQTLKMYLPEFRQHMRPKAKISRGQSLWDVLRPYRGLKLDIKPIGQTVKKITL